MTATVAPFVAVTRALKKLVEQDVLVTPGDEEIKVCFEAPDKQYVASLSDKPELNLYMYSCQENLERRYGETFPVKASDGDSKTIGRAPMLVDLNYMVSAWSRSEEDNALVEQYLLSRVVQGMGKYNMFPVELLQEENYDPGPSGVVIKILLDQDSKRSQGEFWSSLGGHPKPVLNIELTVPVDVHTPIVTPVIASLDTTIGRIEVPRDEWERSQTSVVLSGLVSLTDGGSHDSLVVHVRAFGSTQRWQTSTDRNGAYAFQELPAGEYLVWVEDTDRGISGSKEEALLKLNDQDRIVPVVMDFDL